MEDEVCGGLESANISRLRRVVLVAIALVFRCCAGFQNTDTIQQAPPNRKEDTACSGFQKSEQSRNRCFSGNETAGPGSAKREMR